MLDRKAFEEAVNKLKNGAVIEDFEYQGYKLNEKKEHVNMIMISIIKLFRIKRNIRFVLQQIQLS